MPLHVPHLTLLVALWLGSAWLCLADDGEEQKKVYRWPKTHEGKQKLAVKKIPTEDAEGAVSAFESKRFRFYSYGKTTAAEWRSIMVVCEGLNGAMRSLPIGLITADEDREGSPRRATVRIYPDEEAYHKAGGLDGTVGIYEPRKREVLIWTHGLKEPGSAPGRNSMGRKQQYDLLVHELSHQALGSEFRRLPVWFNEGIAEYLAAAHFDPGRYSFKDPTTSVRDHIRKYLADLAKRESFKIVPLKLVTSLSHQAWNDNTINADGHGPYLKYASALLLVHYFCHLDPKRGDGKKLRNFTTALRSGQPGSRATVEHLLDDSDLAEIEEKIETFWRQKGLRIDFSY